MALKAGRVGVNPNYVDKEGRPLYDNSYLKELLRKEGIITLFTKEGNPISIDNAVAGRVYDFVVNMLPKQAGTGTPSKDNVREISGFTSITATVNGTDTEVSLGRTVYGGTLDLIRGVLTVNFAIIGVSEMGFFTTPSAGGLCYGQDDLTGAKLDGLGFCNMAPVDNYGAWGSTTPCAQISYTTPGRIRFYCEETTQADFLEAYADLQLVYELATPTTIQLTAQDIQLLTGSNTVSSDAGTTMDLKYLGTLVPGGANGRSLNRSLNLNREVIDGAERKEIQEEIKEEVKEVPVEEPVTTKKSTKKSTK